MTSPNLKLGWPQNMTQGWKGESSSGHRQRRRRESGPYLPVLVGEVLIVEVPERFQPPGFGQVAMRKGLFRGVHLVLLVRCQPLRHDVGIGQRGVGARGDEEHGDASITVDLHLAGQAFQEIVSHAGRVAQDQRVPSVPGGLQDGLAKFPDHRVRVSGGRLGQRGQGQAVRVPEGILVHGPGMGGRRGRAGDVGDLFEPVSDDPVGGADAVPGTGRGHHQEAEDVLLFGEPDQGDLGEGRLHFFPGIKLLPASRMRGRVQRRREARCEILPGLFRSRGGYGPLDVLDGFLHQKPENKRSSKTAENQDHRNA